jgi:hypothetical protein
MFYENVVIASESDPQLVPAARAHPGMGVRFTKDTHRDTMAPVDIVKDTIPPGELLHI